MQPLLWAEINLVTIKYMDFLKVHKIPIKVEMFTILSL